MATDGDASVVGSLEWNLFLNGLEGDSSINTAVLKLGRTLYDTFPDEEQKPNFDIVIGADVVSGLRSIRELFALIPSPYRHTTRL